ncbi:transcriptional regulator [Mycolicibacterium boenickei]|uniref:Transcriptional regulator n=1 Tax=Mycolicibacterium boenickei TaxID=146017 RepID=A0AAX3A2V0_9MYCO|nr:transcriptional regulator [Mycolicibacterium boenickei]PEG59260.1 transcriptional regulator [Mycolicibacterium boenickei]UNC01669.1 transcriptional regulator [Mycolicibacterium boenickei]
MSKQFTLNLLGEFAVYRDMEPVVLPPSCRRLVALTAVKRRELHRSWVCDLLWPGSPPQKAVSSLRSALWRLRPLGADCLLVVEHQYVSLAPEVKVDWHEALALHEAMAVIDGRPAPATSHPVLRRLARSGDLLEGWPDPWCAAERDRYRAIKRSVLDAPDSPARQVTHYAVPGSRPGSHGGRHHNDNAGCRP